MANPQLEDKNWFKFHRDVWDALVRTRIPGEARQVLDFIIRKSWGWKKPEARIPLSKFCNATGLNKPAVSRAIKKLIDMNLIKAEHSNKTPIYRFNKYYDTWKPLSKKIMHKPLSKKITAIIEKDNKNGKSLSKKITTSLYKENYVIETSLKDIKDDVLSKNQNGNLALFKKLLEIGIRGPGVVRDLIEKHEPALLESRLEILNYVLSCHPEWAKNPPGYFIASLNGTFEMPAGFDEWRDRMRTHRRLREQSNLGTIYQDED